MRVMQRLRRANGVMESGLVQCVCQTMPEPTHEVRGDGEREKGGRSDRRKRKRNGRVQRQAQQCVTDLSGSSVLLDKGRSRVVRELYACCSSCRRSPLRVTRSASLTPKKVKNCLEQAANERGKKEDAHELPAGC